MYSTVLEKLREAIRTGAYDLTHHAVEEMAEDDLGIADIECAVVGGTIVRKEFDDLRGPKYVVTGVAVDGVTKVGVVCRFKETGTMLIITVYEISETER
ncbi:MAG: DUF4258 domain-containing protein [Deltaproteobacteria bacterium]|nr:DUF4258 domain-containing protein [Deltaproteobacteria bacterium]